MKRQKRKAVSRKRQAAPSAGSPSGAGPAPGPRRKPLGRRDLLQNIGYGALAVALVGGGGWYLASSVHAGFVEGDLSRIGNGTPTVVQIHDPQCPKCRALQAETRAALARLDGEEIQYVVANIRQEEGRRLAAVHGVQHVTLLLFDGNGRRRGVIVGENDREYLLTEFRRLIGRPAGS